MKKAFAVARWEYMEKIKSKAFLISLILMPIIMIGFGVLPTLLASQADTEPRIIGVIDATGQLFDALRSRVETRYKLPDGQPNYVLRLVGEREELEVAKKQADRLVVHGDLEGYLIIATTVFQDSVAEYRAKNVGNLRVVERFTATLRDIVFERRLQEAGVNPGLVTALRTKLELRTVKVTAKGIEEAGFEQVFFSAYLFMMMMFFLVATSGQLLVRSVVEEKANRVVEILVSSCSPTDLMAGKILGLSGLGLTQVSVWALIGVVISLKFGIALASLDVVLLLLIYLILGYLFYAAIFVAAGSPISTEQEAQQITSYLVLVLVLPLVLALSVLQNPESTMVKVLSLIPLLTPTMMAIRIPVLMPSTAEIVASILILAASTLVAMWAAGRIFRTAILAYGKRPSIGEIIRLLKTAN
jgi:ABC-2 type transport system permease protein